MEDVAYVVVTHIPRDYESKLDKVLAMEAKLPIVRVTEGIEVAPQHIYVIAENTYLTIKEGVLTPTERDESAINQAVDIFFESLAEDFKSKAIGVILSGVGSDGLKGVKHIEDNGGFVLVQHPDTAQFDGMPMSVIKFDHPDVIDGPQQLAKFVAHYINSFQIQLKH